MIQKIKMHEINGLKPNKHQRKQKPMNTWKGLSEPIPKNNGNFEDCSNKLKRDSSTMRSDNHLNVFLGFSFYFDLLAQMSSFVYLNLYFASLLIFFITKSAMLQFTGITVKSCPLPCGYFYEQNDSKQ